MIAISKILYPLKHNIIIISLLAFSYDYAFAFSSGVENAPPIKTNVNEVTNEFDEYISDRRDFDTQVESLRELGVNASKSSNINDILDEESKSSFDTEKNRLSSINPNDLESEGLRERANPRNNYFEEFETDYTRPGAMAHKIDAEEIVAATARKLGELTKTLRDIGIDCVEASKSTDLTDPYYIDIEREGEKDVEYDQKFCEQAQGNYACTETIKLTCTHKTSTPWEESLFRASLPKSYDPGNGILTFGWPYNFTQGGGHGTQHDYSIKFNIEALAAVSEFTLSEVGYDDFLRVTVNGIQVFNGPKGGDRLELLTDRIMYDSGAPGYPYYGVRVDGTDTVYCADQFRWRRAAPYINLLPYLKEGENTIEIRLIVGGGGGLWLKFVARVNACNSWNEAWEEQCIHRK